MKLLAVLLLSLCAPASAQFEILDAHTTASLRGIDAVSPEIAWASGSAGTVLLTTDGGATWKHCAVPPGGDKLDFRGVQAFDAQTAVIMASGKGPLSAIFKTVDGCATWKKVFADPDAEGFFDALRKVTGKQMYLLGDPVGGKFSMFYSADQGSTWFIADDPGLDAEKGDGAFAASNSSLTTVAVTLFFGTGGAASAHVYNTYAKCPEGSAKDVQCPLAWGKTDVPVAAGSDGAGVFSVAGRTRASMCGVITPVRVAVGGDYRKPESGVGTAATAIGIGKWSAAATPPHGYRSAVVFSSKDQLWIAVGPNGTDVSRDDGKNWTALLPGPQETADADKGWNAIALPFVVGARGRIGKLRPLSPK